MSRTTKTVSALIVILSMFFGYLPVKSEIEAVQAESTSDFDQMRSKWHEVLTGGAWNDPNDPDVRAIIEAQISVITNDEAIGHWDTMNKNAERTTLWEDLASTISSPQITSSYNRIMAMARVYGTIGSTYYKNASLREDIIGALEWMYANRYNELSASYDNWWDWELGIPLELNNIMTIMFDDLTEEQVERFSRPVLKYSPGIKYNDTGANRLWRVSVLGLSGVLNQNAALLLKARDGISDVLLYVNDGDGFYEDGSFIQHNKHPYNGGYGKALLGTIANIIYLLKDSAWEVTDPNIKNVYSWVTDSFEPLIYNGALMDMVRGREISREYAENHVVGHQTISAILMLSRSADSVNKLRFERMVKNWIVNDHYRNYISHASLNVIGQAKALLQNSDVQARDEYVLNKAFSSMERVVHHREEFAVGLSLSSNRTYKYEALNNENLKSWYTSDGMTYLYNGDLSQYSDGFWATVNPYRLPGTTVDTRERIAGNASNYTSKNQWAGGTVLDDVYGISGMELDAEGSDLKAKKSWFMFDDEIVALGAGISSNENRTIETIIENRKLSRTGSNILTVDGAVKMVNTGSQETMNDTLWAHLSGETAESDIGYFFPGSAKVEGLRELRTGAWSDINQSKGSSDLISNHFLNLWFDHGVNPNNAEYAYVLLPNKTAAQTGEYSESPDIQIVKNTEEVQAVRESDLGILGVNFWDPGRVEYIKSYQASSVIVQEEAGQLSVSVSDPTHAQDKVIIELSKAATNVISQDPTITILETAPIKFAVNTAGSMGRSHMIKLSYDSELMNPVKKLYPEADAYVDSTQPDSNFGSEAWLEVDAARESLLRFGLPSLNEEIDAATLNLLAISTGSPSEGQSNVVHEVIQNDWIETGSAGVTWNSKPLTGNELGVFTANEKADWVSLDMTEYIRSHFDENHKAGFAIKQSEPGLISSIYSKETDNPDNRPYLVITSYLFTGAQLDRVEASIEGPSVIKVGTSTRLMIAGRMEDDTLADLTEGDITYVSSHPNIISVDNQGNIAAIKAGRSTITISVTLDGRMITTDVSVAATVNGLRTIEILAEADSYVHEKTPDTNYGSATGVPVTNSRSQAREAYFKFDLSQIEGEIYSAKLKLWATNTDGKGGMKENKVYITDNSWEENTITWNNKPAASYYAGSINVDPGWKWQEADVTSAIVDQMELDRRPSFVVLQEGETRFINIFSREKPSEQPRLVLQTYDTPPAEGADRRLSKIHATVPGATVLKVGTGTSLTVEGVMEDLSITDLAEADIIYNSSKPSVVTIDTQGNISAVKAGKSTITVTATLYDITKTTDIVIVATADGLKTIEVLPVADSYVASNLPDQNYGSTGGLPVTSNKSGIRQAYFKFDLSGVQDEIYSATFKLWATNSDGKGGVKENKVYQTSNDWTEDEITWSNKPAAGSYMDSFYIDPGWKWQEANVSTGIAGQTGAGQTFSFVVLQEGEARYITIYSKEKTSEQPRLVLQTYTLEEDEEEF
ncbi:CBM96 family carbohydrate-binding protein [Paenibacillus sp. IITD108]|uniref:CBM96 family carbohydrate-binding protein n=1 Tax=Paenibacillus sp. IITD108 TaxID=3116649 RepID=UPI002F3FACDF